MFKMSKRLMVILMAFVLVLAACGSKEASDTSPEQSGEKQEEGKTSGGELKVAISAQPATLDQPTTTNTSTRDISRLIFETLVTTNSSFEAVPMLAEKIDQSEDSKTYTFHLREGVKFHNGKEMVAEDVVASMERWVEKSSVTGKLFDGATFKEEDEYTVVLELAEPSVLILDTMASSKMAAAIMPKEIIEAAGDEEVEEYIGTGPFEFAEWKADQYIHLTKYDDYAALDEEPDGLAGKKEALVDDIYFESAGDSGTRFSGLQTDLYDIAYALEYDSYEQLQNDSSLEPVLENVGELTLVYNKVEGVASDVKLRQAINMALDLDAIMLSAFANEDIFWLDSSYMTRDIEAWASDAGKEYYNQKDMDKAKELLAESDYDGEEFTLMVSRDYPHFYNAAVVVHEQLTNLGINAKLDVYDWPTFADLQSQTGQWDAFVSSSGTVSTPTQLLAVSPTYGGGVNNDHILDLIEEVGVAPTQEEAKAKWDELQLYAWEEYVPLQILGGYRALYGSTDKVDGFYAFLGGVYWNVSVNK